MKTEKELFVFGYFYALLGVPALIFKIMKC